ncbi:hypothetical protein [Chitinophaga alhagiae]|uniref:hypothetical protein n=1 Tax=Chitinophaga alhagiae TaxID=2203219 RepID=UPI000E5A77BD|nr:hypothetical protein [Chitinophaga alhagiae]
MQRNYNYIYSKLVENDTDLIGHIAYSLYKKSKVEYIEKQNEGGKTLTDAELIPFNDFSSSESSIESYRIKAELIVQGFIDNVLDEELTNYKQQAITQQAEILKNIIAPITPSFWKNVWIGIVSSFIFTLVLAALFFIKTFGDYKINFSFEQKKPEPKQLYAQ